MEKGVKVPQTVDEILEDPSRYGLPTFEQFSKNPSAWRFGDEYLLESVDAGSKILNKGFRKYTYEIAGYKTDSLEEVQRIAGNEGLNLKTMEMRPRVIPDVFGFETIHVQFVTRGNGTQRGKR